MMPEANIIDYIEEPYVKVSIIAPNEYVGTLMDLAQSKRGIFINMNYLDKVRVDLIYHIPLSEVITDFYDQLKSRTKGYASMDYEFAEYKRSKLVKLDVMLAGEVVDALSVICHEDNAFYIGQKLTEKLNSFSLSTISSFCFKMSCTTNCQVSTRRKSQDHIPLLL